MFSKVKNFFRSSKCNLPSVEIQETDNSWHGTYEFLNEKIKKVNTIDLSKEMNFNEILKFPIEYYKVPLTEWKMETHDAVILRYIYRNFSPLRHLEFGTWKGEGVILCLNECRSTVWTINLWEGEKGSNEGWAYGEKFENLDSLADQCNTKIFADPDGKPLMYHRTDSYGMIGRFYLEAGLGKRVCQIYCDSQEWDTSNYPKDFFDSCLIDGGHSKEVVINDTFKALEVTKSGGLVMWHDFCPDKVVLENCSAPRGVCEAIAEIYPELEKSFSKLFWIYPSWILVGIKK